MCYFGTTILNNYLGHFARDITLHAVTEKYWWKGEKTKKGEKSHGMTEDIVHYVHANKYINNLDRTQHL